MLPAMASRAVQPVDSVVLWHGYSHCLCLLCQQGPLATVDWLCQQDMADLLQLDTLADMYAQAVQWMSQDCSVHSHTATSMTPLSLQVCMFHWKTHGILGHSYA